MISCHQLGERWNQTAVMIIIQVNEKNFGTNTYFVEKAQEKSWDTDMHNIVHLCHHHSGYILECGDTPT